MTHLGRVGDDGASEKKKQKTPASFSFLGVQKDADWVDWRQREAS